MGMSLVIINAALHKLKFWPNYRWMKSSEIIKVIAVYLEGSINKCTTFRHNPPSIIEIFHTKSQMSTKSGSPMSLGYIVWKLCTISMAVALIVIWDISVKYKIVSIGDRHSHKSDVPALPQEHCSVMATGEQIEGVVKSQNSYKAP